MKTTKWIFALAALVIIAILAVTTTGCGSDNGTARAGNSPTTENSSGPNGQNGPKPDKISMLSDKWSKVTTAKAALENAVFAAEANETGGDAYFKDSQAREFTKNVDDAQAAFDSALKEYIQLASGVDAQGLTDSGLPTIDGDHLILDNDLKPSWDAAVDADKQIQVLAGTMCKSKCYALSDPKYQSQVQDALSKWQTAAKNYNEQAAKFKSDLLVAYSYPVSLDVSFKMSAIDGIDKYGDTGYTTPMASIRYALENNQPLPSG